MVELRAYHTCSLAERAGDFTPDSRLSLEQVLFIPVVYYIQALRVGAMAFSDISDSFKHFNVIVAPTEPMVALKVGEQLIRFGDAEEDVNFATGRYVAPFNLTGLPAISIPCDFSTEGLPIGMRIIGNAYEESTVLRVAHAYEQKAEWYKQ